MGFLGWLFGAKQVPQEPEKYENGIQNILASTLFSEPFDSVKKRIYEYSKEKQMSMDDTVNEVKSSIYKIAAKSLEDNIITAEEDKKISLLCDEYEISWDDIDDDAKTLLAKGRTIRDLIDGNVHPRVSAPDLPFNLMKSEVLIWVFPGTQVYERKTSSQFVGGSSGVSIRVTKGVYWRVGAFKGERVNREEIIPLGLATVAITSNHLYFSVGLDSRRIKHDKIISIAPYKNAVLVVQDGVRAKPLFFIHDDPWCFINVLQNARNWS